MIDPAYFDSVVPASYLKFKHIEFERHRQDGVGAALVGHRTATPARLESEPFLPPPGLLLSVTSTLDFSAGDGAAELAFTDVLEKDTYKETGSPLTIDFTAPLASLYNYVPRGLGLKGVLNPGRFADQTGLVPLEPFRPDEIPVIFVHGLKSSPDAWIETINSLHTDPVLREKLQLMTYFYPTGFPVSYTAAGLRRSLNEFQEHYDPERRNPIMRRMIIIGHSMGGILSNYQIRTTGDGYPRQAVYAAPR